MAAHGGVRTERARGESTLPPRARWQVSREGGLVRRGPRDGVEVAYAEAHPARGWETPVTEQNLRKENELGLKTSSVTLRVAEGRSEEKEHSLHGDRANGLSS